VPFRCVFIFLEEAMTTEGCWVTFYDGEDMEGATLSINGPINVPDMNVYKFSNGRKGAGQTHYNSCNV
jgi:hypothetical protein